MYILRFLKIYAIIASIFLITACSDSDDSVGSGGVDTEDTYFDIHFTDNGSGSVSVSTQLLTDGPGSDTQVYLSDNDQLWASKDQNIENLSVNGTLFNGFDTLAANVVRLYDADETDVEIDFLFLSIIFRGNIWYANLLEAGEASTVYYLSYVRSRREDALDSTVILPEPFSISAPLAGERHSRVNDLQIIWEPSGSTSTVEINVRASCLSGFDGVYREEIADTGAFTMPGGSLIGLSEDCSTVVEVSKSLLGNLDPNVGSGRIVGHQVRRVAITTTN